MNRFVRTSIRRLAVGAGCAGIALLSAAGSVRAAVVALNPVKDNTMFQEDGNLSNGAGVYCFTGATNFVGLRRALLDFDIAAKVPAGATITSVTLQMNVSRLGPFFQPTDVGLYRLSKDWGEAASDAGSPGGNGAPAMPGDVTWVYRFYDTASWGTLGGEFASTASGVATVTALGFLTWGSTSGMVADAQFWLTHPADDHGWILIGDEHLQGTATRFDTRENPTSANRPLLTITYTPPPTPVGSVPDGNNVPGSQVTVAKAPGGMLSVAWGASCIPTDADYEIYEGTLGDFDSHTPKLCSTSGATNATFMPGAGDHYYVVVARNASAEGSYGRASNGLERPPSASACRPQAIGACP